jgi:hypothetical protein
LTLRHDPRAELEQVRVPRVEIVAATQCVLTLPERLDAGGLGQALPLVERLVELEVVLSPRVAGFRRRRDNRIHVFGVAKLAIALATS